MTTPLRILPAEGPGEERIGRRVEVFRMGLGGGLRVELVSQSESDARECRATAIFLARAFLLLAFVAAGTFFWSMQHGE